MLNIKSKLLFTTCLIVSFIEAQIVTYEDSIKTNAIFYKNSNPIKISTKYFNVYFKLYDTSIISFDIKNTSNKRVVIDTKRMYFIFNQFKSIYTLESDSSSIIILNKSEVYKSNEYYFNKKNISFEFYFIIDYSKGINKISWVEYLLFIDFNELNFEQKRKKRKKKMH